MNGKLPEEGFASPLELGLLLEEVFSPETSEKRRIELLSRLLPHLAQKLTDETLGLLLDLLRRERDGDDEPGPHQLTIEHLPLVADRQTGVPLWPLVAVSLAELGIPTLLVTAEPNHPLLERLVVREGLAVEPLMQRLPTPLRRLWHHPGLAELGLLALLSPPAGESCRLVGVGSGEWAPLIAQAGQDSAERIYVVSGREGRDFASTAHPSRGMFVMGELIFSLEIEPERLMVHDRRWESISPEEQWVALERLLAGDETSPLARPLALNSALALELVGRVVSFAEGIDLMLDLIIKGRLTHWFSP